MSRAARSGHDAGPTGLLLVDKPPEWTSHDVVARVRRLAGTRRVGHAGTLDPMATGLLLLGLGRGTRLLTYLVGCDKRYTATIRLGVATVSDDADGEVTARVDAAEVSDEQVQVAVASLTGQISQVPSSVSAVKVGGRRAYARVRAGDQVTLAPRQVLVHSFDVLGSRPARVEGLQVRDVDVAVACSSGTYVRALARDVGALLGVGAHLTALRRTAVGPFDVGQARPLEELTVAEQPPGPEGLPLISLAEAARAVMPERALDADEATLLGHGQGIPAAGLGPGPLAAIGPDGVLVAVLEETGSTARPLIVLTPA